MQTAKKTALQQVFGTTWNAIPESKFGEKKRGKKAWCRAAVWSCRDWWKPSREWKLWGEKKKKKKANMIKSVSQWLVAFSRHGERRVQKKNLSSHWLLRSLYSEVFNSRWEKFKSWRLARQSDGKTRPSRRFRSTANATGNLQGHEVSGPGVWLWAAGPALPTLLRRTRRGRVGTLSRLDYPTVLHKYVSGGKPRALLKYPALPRKVTQWGRRCGWMWLSVQGGHK